MLELQQLRADVLGEVRKSRQAKADTNAQMVEAQESTQRSLLGLQNRLVSSLTLQPPLASHPFPSNPYAGYAPYPPTGFPHAMQSMHGINAMPSPASMVSTSMQGKGGGGFRRQPSGGRSEGESEASWVVDSSQQQPFPQRVAAGSLPPLVQGEGFARSRGFALGGGGRGRAQGHK